MTTSHVLSHVPNKQCGERLKTMRLTVKYTLNNEVRLTTGVYGILVPCLDGRVYTH